jgi:GT2 family glycosyltransferase
MITIVYSTHKDSNYNNKFKQHLLQSVGLKNVQILEYQNNNQYSLSQVYNSGITESIYNIVVCCHNDIKLENGWGKKLLNDFSNNPEFGVIGKAGSCYFPESGVYWERMAQTMVGHVYHHPEGKNKWLNKYSAKTPGLTPVVTLDGLFISFDKTKIKHRFDETIGKFHFYDHPFCLSNYLEGVKLGVTFSFDITHQSVGMPNQEFFDSKEVFLNKFKEHLPLDLKPENIYIPTIKEKPIKNIGKVAVIIPTKGKVEMLFECVNSFYQNCNSNLFDIFIADTGSTDDEKTWIRENILPLGNVTLIEYDYYNYAKINNDVVKNHINDDYEFLLFCNNDIKILNNVIYGMLNVFKTKHNVGTVGCRLHFEDNTIQHDGVIMFVDKQSKLHVSHKGLQSYFNFTPALNEVLGSTAALLMIRKNVFNNVGTFNESYVNCFEDVELNLQCLINGYLNYCDSNLVAYHYESVTRKDENKIDMSKDYFNSLVPFVSKNFEKVSKYIVKTS